MVAPTPYTSRFNVISIFRVSCGSIRQTAIETSSRNGFQSATDGKSISLGPDAVRGQPEL